MCLDLNNKQRNSVVGCKLTMNVTSLCSVIHASSHINVICVQNQQIVKGLCIVWE